MAFEVWGLFVNYELRIVNCRAAAPACAEAQQSLLPRSPPLHTARPANLCTYVYCSSLCPVWPLAKKWYMGRVPDTLRDRLRTTASGSPQPTAAGY